MNVDDIILGGLLLAVAIATAALVWMVIVIPYMPLPGA